MVDDHVLCIKSLVCVFGWMGSSAHLIQFCFRGHACLGCKGACVQGKVIR